MSGRKAGHSIVEYALPAMLLGLIVVGSMVALLNGNFAQTGAVAMTQGGTVSQQSGRTLVNARPLGQLPALQGFQFLTENGSLITLPGYADKLASMVEADGGNGTTQKLLANVDALINQLLASGEITPQQAQQMKDLSNAGHDLARLQKIVETSLARCGSDLSCRNNLIRTDTEYARAYVALSIQGFNASVNIQDPHMAAAMMGDYKLDAPLSSVLSRVTPEQVALLKALDKGPADYYRGYLSDPRHVTMGNGLVSLLQKYQEVTAKVPLSPRVSQVLSDLVGGVATVSQRTQTMAARMEGRDGRRTVGTSETQNQLMAEMLQDTQPLLSAQLYNGASGSDVSHENSAGVCALGQRMDVNGVCH